MDKTVALVEAMKQAHVRMDALHNAIAEIAHALQSPLGGSAVEVVQLSLEESNAAREASLRSIEEASS